MVGWCGAQQAALVRYVSRERKGSLLGELGGGEGEGGGREVLQSLRGGQASRVPASEFTACGGEAWVSWVMLWEISGRTWRSLVQRLLASPLTADFRLKSAVHLRHNHCTAQRLDRAQASSQAPGSHMTGGDLGWVHFDVGISAPRRGVLLGTGYLKQGTGPKRFFMNSLKQEHT